MEKMVQLQNFLRLISVFQGANSYRYVSWILVVYYSCLSHYHSWKWKLISSVMALADVIGFWNWIRTRTLWDSVWRGMAGYNTDLQLCLPFDLAKCKFRVYCSYMNMKFWFVMRSNSNSVFQCYRGVQHDMNDCRQWVRSRLQERGAKPFEFVRTVPCYDASQSLSIGAFAGNSSEMLKFIVLWYGLW